MKLGRNLLAGVTNSIWSALVGLAVVPFYLKYLGIEAYGLIGFFVTTQALLSILDMGMAPTINREVARCSASGNLQEAGKLLHTLAIVYWGVAGVIALLAGMLAPTIANYWLQSKALSLQTISNAVMLMGLVVACRWPIGLYQGALIGSQRLMISSAINMLMVTIGSLGAVAVLEFFSPTIEAFFAWQAGVGFLYALVIRFAAWRVIGRVRPINFDLNQLKSVWRFAAGMGGIGLTALVFTQLDKLILSKLLELEEFGHYMLATVVVSGLSIVVAPLFNVIYPRFSVLVINGDVEKLTTLYRLGTRMLATLIFPAAMLLAIFSKDLLFVWTGNSEIATNVAPVISTLVIGTALNSVMYFPYALQLAYGMTWIPLTINVALMMLVTPLLIYLAQTYGALGGAIAWSVSQLAYLVLGPWLTHRHILKGLGLKWVVCDVGAALVLSVLAGMLGYYVIGSGHYSIFEKIILAVLLTIFTSVLALSFSRDLRGILWKYAKQYIFKSI